jgi:translation initiation factor IF-2
LDAASIELLAAGYDKEVSFVDAEEVLDTDDEDEQDDPEDLVARPPVVTVMGHVDHGKTSLLDYIKNSKVAAGEAGGITQHIGAYSVKLDDGRLITFLDTPGHEAFTAMRARGAKATDIVILVVAADDAVMPQTIEAINHAQAANVPIVVAVNKMDKPDANPDRIKQQLSEHNVLVEEWGGKTQCVLVSAKTGKGIDDLLESVLVEAELMELKANPARTAQGVVLESRVDKGKGAVATILVQNGTLRVGDPFVAGQCYGRIRALENERGERLQEVGPATPALVTGFDGMPQAGDKVTVTEDERTAKTIAMQRQQIKREQDMRRVKHMTLDDLSRRMALGNVSQLNIIIKGDVDGSIEALSGSLQKLSTDEVQVKIIHTGVGAITESDVLLASASDAIIIGFQVRPSANARKLAESEQIDIRLFSIIYDALDAVKDAMEGMLSPELSEKTLATVQVREIFKVPGVGTIGGCFVQEGKIERKNRIRLIRDGVVIFTGEISSLKRFKDDVREVNTGFECGIGIHNYNDLKVGDVIEAFEVVETKRKLSDIGAS